MDLNFIVDLLFVVAILALVVRSSLGRFGVGGLVWRLLLGAVLTVVALGILNSLF